MVITPDQLAGRTEHSQQVALFAQAALHVHKYPQLKWIYAVPNGFFSTSGEKNKMKAEGLRDGVPDICLPVPFFNRPERYYAGLYIELKIESRRKEKNGGCSDDQLNYIAYLQDAGYFVAVCYGWQDAWRVIEEYLNGH